MFTYDILKSSEKQIRLLRLEDASSSALANPRWTLTTSNLHEAPAYHALSYTWGSPYGSAERPAQNLPFDWNPPRDSIILNGHQFAVRANLYAFLVEFAASAPPQSKDHVWCDALCINMDDMGERNAQVRLIGNIYQKAKSVLIWLGPSHGLMDELAALVNRWSTQLAALTDLESKSFRTLLAEDRRYQSTLTTNKAAFQRSSNRQLRAWLSFSPHNIRTYKWEESIINFTSKDRTNLWQLMRELYDVGSSEKHPSPLLPTNDAASVHREKIHQELYDFSNRSYWTRLWTIPEVLLAQTRTIFCGRHTFSLDVLCTLCLMFENYMAALGTTYAGEQDSGGQSNMLKWVSILKKRDFFGQQGPEALSLILDVVKRLGCEDVSDRIYALIPLLKWDHSISIDYQQPHSQLFFQVISTYSGLEPINAAMKLYKTLNIAQEDIRTLAQGEWFRSEAVLATIGERVSKCETVLLGPLVKASKTSLHYKSHDGEIISFDCLWSHGAQKDLPDSATDIEQVRAGTSQTNRRTLTEHVVLRVQYTCIILICSAKLKVKLIALGHEKELCPPPDSLNLVNRQSWRSTKIEVKGHRAWPSCYCLISPVQLVEALCYYDLRFGGPETRQHQYLPDVFRPPATPSLPPTRHGVM